MVRYLAKNALKPRGAEMALMMGTRMKMAPTTRWLTRMARETSGNAAASCGTKTNRPDIASQMQQIATVPCVMRVCSEWRGMTRSGNSSI